MRFSLSILLILSSIYICTAQDISVKSFGILQNDLDAKVNYPKRDQNNEVCAIIKVVTTQTGFKFDVGSLGVVATEQKTGEIWVYVPRGVQRITISHGKLGVLRNYPFNTQIEAGTVYELVLTTARVITTIEQPQIESQWLVITSQPEGADVFIDNIPVGKTPHQKMYKEGKYDYRVEFPKYYTQAGRVTLENEKQQIDLVLKPKFGNIKVSSTPENGMEIYLNNENTGKTTPATIEVVSSGENRVQLRSIWYEHQAKNVTVKDEETTTINFQMIPAYANVTINANPSANIMVNNERKGSAKWEGRLTMGVYNILAEKEKYYSQTRSIEIVPGKDQHIDIELKPKTGVLNIATNPIGASVSINGEYKGKAPLRIKDLLIGEYNLTIEEKGYGTVNKKITISENQELGVNETLSTGLAITIETNPPGADIYVDDSHKGTTPKNISLEYGNRKIKFVYKGKTVTKDVKITENSENCIVVNLYECDNHISITSNVNDADVYIDGLYVGKTPVNYHMTDKKLPVEVKKKGYISYKSSLICGESFSKVYLEKEPTLYEKLIKDKFEHQFNIGHGYYSDKSKVRESKRENIYKLQSYVFDYQLNYKLIKRVVLTNSFKIENKSITKLYVYDYSNHGSYKNILDYEDYSTDGLYFGYNPSIELNLDFFRISLGYIHYTLLKSESNLLSKTFDGVSLGFAYFSNRNSSLAYKISLYLNYLPSSHHIQHYRSNALGGYFGLGLVF